jgi:hypothetical protein
VSKRLTAPYRSGPSRDWIKVKNPDSPAVLDLMGETDAVIRSRYIRTGPFRWPTVEALSDTCENLRQDFGAALKGAGVALRL